MPAVSVWADELCILSKLTVARGLLQRGLGLMGRPAVPNSLGNGLLFPHCRSLHTAFMRFPLHVAFVDREGKVLAMHEGVGAWRILKGPPGSAHALEWTGVSENLRIGAHICLRGPVAPAGKEYPNPETG